LLSFSIVNVIIILTPTTIQERCQMSYLLSFVTVTFVLDQESASISQFYWPLLILVLHFMKR